MRSYLRILLIFQVLMCLDAQTKSGTVFIGTEGGSVEISCSYEESYRYVKHYFCRAPCSNSDVLIETKEADKTISKNKYTILNTVSARSISVTIRKLSLRDSGVYYCGVEEWGRDTLTKVRVSVMKAPTTQTTKLTNPTSSLETTHYTDTHTTYQLSSTAQPTHSSAHKNLSKPTPSQTPPTTSLNSSAFLENLSKPTPSQTPPTTSLNSSAFLDLPFFGGVLSLLLFCVLVALVVLYRRRSITQTTSLKPQVPENQTLDPPADQEEFCHIYDEMMAVYSLAGPVVREDPSELYSIIQPSPPAGEDSLYSLVTPH